MTTKIVALTDALGNLVRFVLLPGQRFDTVGVPPLIDGLADGDVVDGVLDEPGLEPPMVLELPVEPLLSELPEVPPEPLLVPWAAAMAGPKPRTRTSIANSKSFMTSSP